MGQKKIEGVENEEGGKKSLIIRAGDWMLMKR